MGQLVKDIIKAVDRLKSGAYKATAIKVELEAALGRGGRFSDNQYCQAWLLRHLEPLGLSVEVEGRWVVAGPLKFAYFYYDGSVDSELTFTLSLKRSRDILLLPQIIEVWNEFCRRANQRGINVDGAGMHMALLNYKNCHYPTAISVSNVRRFHNFQRSMTLALPALYFLSSHNSVSRRLGSRTPRIAMNDAAHGSRKCNAINYKGGALEFRIFDTCYFKPQAILDNVVVMSNCMRYWTNKFTDPGLDKVANCVSFGLERDLTLERLYCSVDHLKLLDAGLELLKPDYYTVKELKQQRDFNVEASKLTNMEAEVRSEAQRQYAEYEERFALAQEEGYAPPVQVSLKDYVSRKIKDFNRRSFGEYTLEV